MTVDLQGQFRSASGSRSAPFRFRARAALQPVGGGTLVEMAVES